MGRLFEQSSRNSATSSTFRSHRSRGRLITGMIASLLVGGLAVTAVSCADTPAASQLTSSVAQDNETTAAAAPSHTPSVSAPFELAGVMRRVHFSFRRDDSGSFSGGHSSYEVRTTPTGIAVTPARTDLARDPKTGSVPSEALGAPAYFETVSFGRGAALHDAMLGDPRVAEEGHLILPRGDFDEQFENTEEGVEQRFAFSKRPEGQGDLVIRVRVSGEDYTGETEGGHHFMDPATGIGLRYGLATWIDAKGERTALRVDYRDDTGALELTVPEDVLEGSAYPAVLDPVISPEFGMDDPIQGYINGAQTQPDIAFGGGNYLVVWNDQRISSWQIIGALVSPTGTLLSPGGLRIGASLGSAYPPGVASSGTSFLVAWTAASSGIATSVLVSHAGVVGAAATPLYTSSSGERPRVASDGTNFLVVHDNGAVRATRVNASGAVVGSTVTVSAAAGSQTSASVAYDGTNYLVVWSDTRNGSASDIYASRVTPAGTVLDPTGIAVSTAAQSQTAPRIAFDGLNYFVVWEDGKWGNPDIYGSRIDKSGLVLDPMGIEIVKFNGNQTAPGLGFDGTRYVITWADARVGNPQIYAARMLPDSTVLDVAGFAVTSNAADHARPVAACNGPSCLLAFEDYRTTNGELWGARIDTATATVLDTDGFAISSAGNEQKAPAVAWSNGQYLAVWEDRRSGTHWDVYGTRIGADGAILDSNGIGISTAPGDQLTPAVGWNGTDFVVVWADKRGGTTSDIYGSRVQANGIVSDPAGVPISTAVYDQTAPAIEYDGTNHLVVWQDFRNNSNWNIYGSRLSPAMSVIDPVGILIEGTTTSGTRPKLAFDGAQYLVVWHSARANRVTPAGTVLDGNGFALGSGMSNPVVAYDGLNFFVTGGTSNIVAQRIMSTGFIVDTTPFVISSDGNYTEQQATIIRDGQGVFVAWLDNRQNNTDYGLYGTWVNQAGDRSHPSGLLISAIPGGTHTGPVVASDGGGHVLVGYQRTETTGASLGHQRVHARLITALAPGLPCTQGGECANGFCVDGVCCNTACGSGNLNDCLACSTAAGAAANGSCTALNAIPCSDGNACTAGDTCMAGTCTAGPIDCTAKDDCHLDGTCNMATGTCTTPTKPNGTLCDDGDGCTQASTCQAGACVGTNPVMCPMDTECTNVAACDSMTGTCAVTNEPDGTACNDGNACTQMSACQAGQCVGSNDVVCGPPNQCQLPGTCNPNTGMCDYAAKPNGTACDDGTACTQMDTCQAGVCVGANPVICPTATDCNTVSACNPMTGTCSVTNQPDGKSCNDGNACTQTDSCMAGQCVGSNPVTCAPPGPCHQGVLCDKNSGQCVYSDKPNGTECDDGNACTQVDTCKSGACSGASPIICTPLDDCHEAGSCDQANGTCSNPAKPDGASCPGGMCLAGECKPSASSSSSSSSSNSSSSSGAGGGGVLSSSSSGVGGEGGQGGSGTAPLPDSGGCSCRSVNTTPTNAPLAALGLATLLLSSRRRRTSKS